MAARRKTLLWVVLALLVLIGGGIYYVLANLNSIVASLIEEQGSIATQSEVRVSGVDIRLREASASISGLTVGNPAGFDGNAIELGEFSVKLDAGSLTGDTIIIDDILVSGARINVIQQGRNNNLQALLDNLSSGETQEEETSSDGGKKLIIDKFTLEGAGASVSLPDLDEQREVTLPTIAVTDIGRKSSGATGAEVARQLLEPILSKTMSAAATESLKDRAKEEIDNAVDGLIRGLGRDSDDNDEN